MQRAYSKSRPRKSCQDRTESPLGDEWSPYPTPPAAPRRDQFVSESDGSDNYDCPLRRPPPAKLFCNVNSLACFTRGINAQSLSAMLTLVCGGFGLGTPTRVALGSAGPQKHSCAGNKRTRRSGSSRATSSVIASYLCLNISTIAIANSQLQIAGAQHRQSTGDRQAFQTRHKWAVG